MSPMEMAKALRDTGVPWAVVARRVGLSMEYIRTRLDPAYREKRRQRNRTKRARDRGEEGRKAPGQNHRTDRGMSPEEAKRAIDAVPPDTRDLTARVFGDPIPSRSALARRTPPPSKMLNYPRYSQLSPQRTGIGESALARGSERVQAGPYPQF